MKVWCASNEENASIVVPLETSRSLRAVLLRNGVFTDE